MAIDTKAITAFRFRNITKVNIAIKHRNKRYHSIKIIFIKILL